MLPANPPLPTPAYLPFQPVTGIHTSILMSESDAGLISAVTRQNAGVASAEAGPPPGGIKGPAATLCAEVIVVSGSLRFARVSQGTAWARGATATRIIIPTTAAKNCLALLLREFKTRTPLFTVSPPA